MENNSCRNCKEHISADWDYCPICGRPVKLKRIDIRYIIQEIADFFFANKGMVYTIKNVLISPGDSVRQFITEDRYRFVKPITFLFVATLVYALVVHLFNVNTEYVIKIDLGERSLSPLLKWFMENPRYVISILALFVALWLKILFKKAGYNFFEILILMCFVSGIATLIDALGAIFHGGAGTFQKILANITLIYQTWAVGHFFGKKKVASYVKALISFILGAISFSILLLIITLIDIVIK